MMCTLGLIKTGIVHREGVNGLQLIRCEKVLKTGAQCLP